MCHVYLRVSVPNQECALCESNKDEMVSKVVRCAQAVSQAVSAAVSQEMAAPAPGLTDMSDQDLLSYINPSTFDQGQSALLCTLLLYFIHKT
jgi:hypothetical protein